MARVKEFAKAKYWAAMMENVFTPLMDTDLAALNTPRDIMNETCESELATVL